MWGAAAGSTWNQRRAAVGSWLAWCQTSKRWPAPSIPSDCERRPAPANAASDLPKTTIDRVLARRDVPLREKALCRMLYETAGRAAEILALNVQDLDLEHRCAPVRSKGGDTEWVHWGTGTAHLLPRLLRLPDGGMRTHGPLFLSNRLPVPARRPAAKDICPHTGRPRLGYDRARILLGRYTGWRLHQLRHSAATHLGDRQVPVQVIMAKTRHKSPRTAIRYVHPAPRPSRRRPSCWTRPAAPTDHVADQPALAAPAWPGWWWRRRRVHRAVRMVHAPPPASNAVDVPHLWLRDGDELVGKLAYQVCDACQQRLICQISIYDAAYRNVGLGRRVIRHAQQQLPAGAAWSTSGQNPEARRFWRRMHLPMALGGQPCPHMDQALDG